MSAISEALVAKLKADTTLTMLAPGGIWLKQAPSALKTTHVVYTLAAGDNEGQFDGVAWKERYYVIETIATTKSAADAAAARIETLLDGGTLTITGYTCMKVEAQGDEVEDLETVNGDTRYYHSGDTYMVMACPT